MPQPLRELVFVHALHGAARLALRVKPPLEAKRIVDAIGRRLPPYRSVDDARNAAQSLRGRGACLSRALTIAARTQGAVVVIGVDPRESGRLEAHAWVEVAGAPLEGVPSEQALSEIARLS